MSNIDFKEYTRIRDIVVKRNKRAVEAGLMQPIHFPTVKEIKSGLVKQSEAVKYLKDYYSSGSQVKTIRQTGLTPEAKYFPEQPKPIPVSEADRKQKRREQQRDYRRRKRIRETAVSPEKAKRYEGYLKALETVSKTFQERGFDIGISLIDLTPTQAQAFVEYMDYRFSQGDFTQRYVIDEFVQDFSKLLSKGHNAKNIIKDFNQFLEKRSELQSNFENMTGLNAGEAQNLWDEFIGDNLEYDDLDF